MTATKIEDEIMHILSGLEARTGAKITWLSVLDGQVDVSIVLPRPEIYAMDVNMGDGASNRLLPVGE